MSAINKKMSADEANAVIEEALIRLERAILNREKQGGANSNEQAVYIERLESDNKQLLRSIEEMKKHCVTLKNGYEILDEKCKRLESANDSAERELAATLRDLDQMIAQKSLH